MNNDDTIKVVHGVYSGLSGKVVEADAGPNEDHLMVKLDHPDLEPHNPVLVHKEHCELRRDT